MTITYLKETAKAKPKTKAKTKKDEQLLALAAELIDIDTALGPHRAEVDILTKAYTDKKKELESLLDLPPEDGTEVLVKGKGMVTVGPMATKTTVTQPEKVAELLDDVKPGLFMELAAVTLGNLKKYLSGIEFANITKTEQNGARRVTVKHNE